MATNAMSLKIVGGGYDLTPYLQKGSIKGTRATTQDTNLSDTVHRYKGARMTAEFSAEGLHSDGTASIETVQEALIGVAGSAFMVCPDGYATLGNDFIGISGTNKQHKIDIPNADEVAAALTVESSRGLDIGRILCARQSITATGAQTGVLNDTSALTANGGAGYLVCDVDNFTTMTVKLQHSSDSTTGIDGVWTDLGTFTVFTGVTSERLLIAEGTTVNKYVRANVTAFTGTAGTITVGFARFAT